MIKTTSFLYMMVLIFSLLIPISCEKERGLAGKYISVNNGTKGSVVFNLELLTNGRGEWSTEEDNVSFKWDVRKEKILLHTKAGGVIAGTINGDMLTVDLPGAGTYRFRKVKE